MNKNLKIGLIIGISIVALLAAIYFLCIILVLRKKNEIENDIHLIKTSYLINDISNENEVNEKIDKYPNNGISKSDMKLIIKCLSQDEQFYKDINPFSISDIAKVIKREVFCSSTE